MKHSGLFCVYLRKHRHRYSKAINTSHGSYERSHIIKNGLYISDSFTWTYINLKLLGFVSGKDYIPYFKIVILLHGKVKRKGEIDIALPQIDGGKIRGRNSSLRGMQRRNRFRLDAAELSETLLFVLCVAEKTTPRSRATMPLPPRGECVSYTKWGRCSCGDWGELSFNLDRLVK